MNNLRWQLNRKVQWKTSDEQISIENLFLKMAAPVIAWNVAQWMKCLTKNREVEELNFLMTKFYV